MTCQRALIASIVFMGLGSGLIFGYCHDSTIGFSAAYPAAGTSLKIVINTTGFPAVAGVGATVIGVVLLFAALVLSVLDEVSARRAVQRAGLPSPRQI
jgi:hypothetical protein